MHWPAFARRGSPRCASWSATSFRTLTLFLDLAKRHRAGTGLKSTIEYLVRTAASVLWSASGAATSPSSSRRERRRRSSRPGAGPRISPDALYELIRVRQEGETHILDLVERHGPHVPSRSTAVILSGTTTLDVARLGPLLDAFAARRVTVAVLAVEADSLPSPSTASPPPSRP